MLSVEGAAFLTSSSDRNASDEARRRFMCPQGDTLTLVNVRMCMHRAMYIG